MHVSFSPAAAAVRSAPTPAGPTPASRSFGAVLDRATSSSPSAEQVARSPARIALDALDRARSDLDAAVAAARTGRTFSPGELLALQSQAYCYSQSFEVASKIVEQATQAVKQAVNTQV